MFMWPLLACSTLGLRFAQLHTPIRSLRAAVRCAERRDGESDIVVVGAGIGGVDGVLFYFISPLVEAGLIAAQPSKMLVGLIVVGVLVVFSVERSLANKLQQKVI